MDIRMPSMEITILEFKRLARQIAKLGSANSRRADLKVREVLSKQVGRIQGCEILPNSK